MVQFGEPVSSPGLLAGVWVRGHLQEEEEELKSRCVDTWMKMGVSGTCCTACKKLHRSQCLLGSSTSLNLLSSSSLDNLETLTHHQFQGLPESSELCVSWVLMSLLLEPLES